MRTIYGLLASFLGLGIASLAIDALAKPANALVSLSWAEALATYRFAFAWVGGTFGTAIGAILALLYIALCFYLGTRLADSHWNRR